MRYPVPWHGEYVIKRKKADENDYEAFGVYREGMQKLLEGMLAYYKFSNLYSEARNSIYALIGQKGFNQEDVGSFATTAHALALQYNEIDFLTKQGVFTEALGKAMKERSESVNLFLRLSNAYLDSDIVEIRRIFNIFKAKPKDNPTEIELLAQWAKEKRQPMFKKQDKKHKKSLDLYNQAYIYAQNERLKEILGVWKNNPPGSLKPGRKTYTKKDNNLSKITTTC